MPQATTLRQQAQETYTQLIEAFTNTDNMWRLGHTFDTIIDYLSIDPSQAPAFADAAVAAWKPLDGQWFDDYAWWGIAALRASQGRLFDFPEQKGEQYQFKFKRIAQSMWGIMDGNAPWVWDNELYPEMKDEYRPLHKGGVWNSNWSDSRWEAGFYNNPDGLVGIQNTVTNGLYLVLSTRMHRAGGTPPTREAADREWRFLSDWFDMEDPERSLLMRFPSGGVLVRERVSTYADGTPVDGYEPGTAWAGDQGLILGGLVDRVAILGTSDPGYPKMLLLAQHILSGVRKKMVKDGVLQPWISVRGTAPGGDPCDYMTGIAVFMRYLLYAFNNWPGLRADIRFHGFGELAAKNGMAPPMNLDCTDTGTNGQMTLLTNQLALLVAAIAITESGQAS